MGRFEKILRLNFEYRVLISYAIFGLALLTLLFSKDYTYYILADIFSIDRRTALRAVFLVIGAINLAAWVFRSYAGGILKGHVVVTKEVQTYRLVTSGPYAYVRNPIYLSDIISMTCVGFAGPPIAVFILFFGKIITSHMYAFYEERHLLNQWGDEYRRYMAGVPRFIPSFSSVEKASKHNSAINWKDGLAYNFYALGIGIAFITAAATGDRTDLYRYGFITPALWFFLRFVDRHLRKFVR